MHSLILDSCSERRVKMCENSKGSFFIRISMQFNMQQGIKVQKHPKVQGFRYTILAGYNLQMQASATQT